MTFQPRLADETRRLLKNRPRTTTIDAIVNATQLNKAWISDFLAYPQRDHGVNKVETLYFFLTGAALLNDNNSNNDQ